MNASVDHPRSSSRPTDAIQWQRANMFHQQERVILRSKVKPSVVHGSLLSRKHQLQLTAPWVDATLQSGFCFTLNKLYESIEYVNWSPNEWFHLITWFRWGSEFTVKARVTSSSWFRSSLQHEGLPWMSQRAHSLLPKLHFFFFFPALKIFKQKQFNSRSYKYQGY